MTLFASSYILFLLTNANAYIAYTTYQYNFDHCCCHHEHLNGNYAFERSPGCRIQSPGLGLRVWGLGYGVWGLGFGV